MLHLHKWITLPISNELRKREVIARKACLTCGRTFIQKPWYRNFFGIYKWMETQTLSTEELNNLRGKNECSNTKRQLCDHKQK